MRRRLSPLEPLGSRTKAGNGTNGGCPFPASEPPAPNRRELRSRRRSLSPKQQHLHAAAVARLVRKDLGFRKAKRIAFYWPSDGELDPRPLLHCALAAGKRCYLPVLSPIRIQARRGRLWLASYQRAAKLRPNRLAILEPLTSPRLWLSPPRLDLIMVPLVGFDSHGRRIGMGGGFYDRSLKHRLRTSAPRRPRLYGLAHECQRVDSIKARAWDVTLDAIFTEAGHYRRRPRKTAA